MILNDGRVLKDALSLNINGVVALLIEALKEERQARLEDKALMLQEQESRTDIDQRLADLELRDGQETE